VSSTPSGEGPPLPSNNHALTDTERLDWLRLARSENVGPVTFRTLLRRFGSAAAALQALPGLARRGGRRNSLRIAGRTDAEREIEAAAKANARLVALCEPDYPTPLAAVEDAPPLLCLAGQTVLLRRPMIAIVGARNASAAGRRIAAQIAAELGAAGTVVVSGLARGIDAAAHEASLESGTCAVLAGGVDIVYPPENRALHERIAAVGLLVSEMPPGTAPQARHFPRRNRIISGLSRGVVVIEAAQRSGSLITARFALEHGREVFAVPGSPLDPRCRGTNDLIRQGAVLTESGQDVLSALSGALDHTIAEPPRGGLAAPPETPSEAELERGRPLVLELLGPTPVEIDELIRQSGLSVPTVLGILLELELAGRLSRSPGQKVALA
jgi:DNA processing protein